MGDVMKVERVQLGVRMEKDLVKVLKGLAEFNDETLGELLERIVLHSFEPVAGDEGESCASPHSRRQLQAIADLRTVYGLTDDVHATRSYTRDERAPSDD
ncbi:hypothetical protein [Intrasporangium sp. YIM S08009]|uniref:hypothetical protein n=1 Tax=Intrasporangium zincisolvens TaxID=3080018 RepID=UPI002B057267|nr:hypothetical protein [Intrasporangium sp. YIM S08009]